MALPYTSEKIKPNKIGLFLLVLVLLITGCAMKNFIQINEFSDASLPGHLKNATKQEILTKFGEPYKIYHQHDRLKKYNAEELWIYRDGVAQDDYLYFKDEHLIKWEYLNWS